MTIAQIERFSNKFAINPETDCWDWTGARSPSGYGVVNINNKTHRVHRIIYELLRDIIPLNRFIDHLCRNRACVNPNHLEVVTHRENTMRGDNIAAKRAVATHCIHGHIFDNANTYINPNGTRACKACKHYRNTVYNKVETKLTKT